MSTIDHSARDYTRALTLNQHPALSGKDRVTALWYVSDAQFDAALAEMENLVALSGIALDLDAIERKAIDNRLSSLAWELDNPMRKHERERRERLLAERDQLEAALKAIDTVPALQAAE